MNSRKLHIVIRAVHFFKKDYSNCIKCTKVERRGHRSTCKIQAIMMTVRSVPVCKMLYEW